MDDMRVENEKDGMGVQGFYFKNLAENRFLIQRCSDCGKTVFYPRAYCVHCGSAQLEWMEPSGKGVVYSFSIVRRKPEAGGDYNVVLVDLAEGVRCMSRVEGIDSGELSIGMPVQAYIEQTSAGPLLLMKKGGNAG